MKHRSKALVLFTTVLLALGAVLASAALAAKIVGTNGDDTLNGTPKRDRISALAGNDKAYGRAGNDLLLGAAGDDLLVGGAGRDAIFGGSGNDRIFGDAQVSAARHLPRALGKRLPRGDRLHGGSGNDELYGGAFRDVMSGGKGDDVQYGGQGDDVIYANQGRDRSFGGPGDDVLWALARADVTAPGDPEGDELDGGAGNDTFRVRDGEVDKITCGPGFDRVYADQYDVITDATEADPTGSCELVQRKDAKGSSDRAEQRQQTQPEDRS